MFTFFFSLFPSLSLFATTPVFLYLLHFSLSPFFLYCLFLYRLLSPSLIFGISVVFSISVLLCSSFPPPPFSVFCLCPFPFSFSPLFLGLFFFHHLFFCPSLFETTFFLCIKKHAPPPCFSSLSLFFLSSFSLAPLFWCNSFVLDLIFLNLPLFNFVFGNHHWYLDLSFIFVSLSLKERKKFFDINIFLCRNVFFTSLFSVFFKLFPHVFHLFVFCFCSFWSLISLFGSIFSCLFVFSWLLAFCNLLILKKVLISFSIFELFLFVFFCVFFLFFF